MKRLSLSFLTFCCIMMVNAEPVGKRVALYTAQNYMLAKGKSIQSAQPSFKSTRKGAAQASDDAYYYVFNAGNDEGYVIISGDDRTEPILGYVEQGSFDPDNIPENMRSWLQFYADEIKYIIDNNIQPDSPLLKKRNKIRGTKHSIPELMSSRWNQGNPYNITCPKYYKGNGSLAYPATGCAATAMAQVINHYKFPEKTKGLIPKISKTYKLDDGTEKTVTTEDIPRNTPIDWENMCDTYSWEDGHVANAQDSAVANLMYYCGQALKMGYGATSGADTSRSRDALVNYFGFDDSAFWGSRANYGIDEWFDMLYNELEAGYPVLYRGHSSGGGHAFVLDGFDGEELFHVNWGWGGGSNGWFLVGILNPHDTSGMGASSSSDGYSMTQGGVFNLRLPDNIKADTYLNIKDISISGTSVKATFENLTGLKSSFNTAVVKLEDDGSLSLVGSQQTISSMANNTTNAKTFAINNKLPEGTYKLSPASKPVRSDKWKAKYNLRDQYIEAIVDSEGVPTMRIVNPVYDISIDTIIFPGTRIAGQEQEVKIVFRNNADEYFKVIYFFASKTQVKTYTESKSMVAVRKGETVEVSFFFKPEETGTYNLWFCTSDKGEGLVGQGSMEVITEAEAEKANLAVKSFDIHNLVSGVACGKRLIGKATIQNNDNKAFRGSIRLQLWKQKVGSNSATSSSTRTYNVDIAAGGTTDVEFNFDNLSEGNYYRVKAMYGNQEGSLTNGGLWDHKWEMKEGVIYWKNDGSVAGLAYRSIISVNRVSLCGLFADCGSRIARLTPCEDNPNAIYAFTESMALPTNIDAYNVVSGNHARHINLYDDNPFFLPTSFEADSASYTYTFPETEAGTGWHAITMPFEVDSIFVDDEFVSLDDTLKHFWIYEFAAQGDGELIFAPAIVLRGGTPYIIAGDANMAGHSVVFRSQNASFFKSGTDKMVVSSQHYLFRGNTLSPVVKDCYVMNQEGTAFEYVTDDTPVSALSAYFTTRLPADLRLPSIVLPDVPVSNDVDPDGITSPRTTLDGKDFHKQGSTIVNLAGQRLSKMHTGINIVGGKKILR